MDPSVEARLTSLERTLELLTERLDRLEDVRVVAAPSPAPAPPTAAPSSIAPPPAPPRVVPPLRGRLEDLDLENLLGGRVLAWVGGSAIVLGVVFFLVMAVRRGWIDEPTRVVLAFVGSTLLLAVGLVLYERGGRTEAAVAAVASSLAALYASLTAATQLYELVDPALGLALAGLVGATGTAIAVRWSSPLVGALGILGALVSPVLVEADTSSVTLAFMAIALASAVAVLLWRRWDWLATAAFLISAPQLLAWIDDTYRDQVALALLVLLGFWALYVVAAIGYELRVPVTRLRSSSALLLLGNALVVAGTGYHVLSDEGRDGLATAWVLGLALAHLAVGAGGSRARMSDEIAALVLSVAVGLSAVGLALALNGPALVAAWSAEAAILAWVAHRTGARRAHLASAVFLGLAAAHILSVEAPPDALREGVDDVARAAVALLAFAVAALLAARLYRAEPPEGKVVYEVVGAAALVYLPSVVIVDQLVTGDVAEPGQAPQVALSAFWSVLGLGGLLFGLARDDRRFRLGGLALLGIAVLKVFLYDLSTLDSLYRVLSFIALGLLLLAGAFAYARMRVANEEELR